MAPIPTPIQNIDASTTAAASSGSASVTMPPVHQPPGQPIILVFVLLTFTLGCSTYFLCRNVRFKKILVSLSAPVIRVSTVNALRAPTKLVAAAPSKTLYTKDKGNTAVIFDPTSNIKASTSASSACTSVLSDSGLHFFKMGHADSQSGRSTTPIEMHSSAAQFHPGDVRLSAPLQTFSTTIKSSFGTIFSRPLPNRSATRGAHKARDPRRTVSTSIDIPELDFVPHLAIEVASRTKSKTSRRHTINLYASAQESPSRGSVKPMNRHARSATAPLTMVLTSNKLLVPMKNELGNESMVVE
ncbi:hypothetical protein PILCRDRAFT_10316 [Piloderma croceum F 1598]|uniref:Uncharacterized protein n=1 Tax=Piloderma croceum (strain F 1598) TaxID=765440 RepID=A0A0C3BQ78_PILCF|nr:hypothetical protein PILCRDRAFT_10316 [Piloderma croceum F 1598]